MADIASTMDAFEGAGVSGKFAQAAKIGRHSRPDPHKLFTNMNRQKLPARTPARIMIIS
ncbi:hypothetical protein [Novosphingobium guangzhouense]|uniref:hypothetical protein n=1 Tax=Novosphingobium guangzhouense TaxID=1850347 RepID=UPI0014734F25|nr:hypothetical protein [Novosphingobium guangzhouense]